METRSYMINLQGESTSIYSPLNLGSIIYYVDSPKGVEKSYFSVNKVYAFQTWRNGGTQVSALYEGDEARQFVDSHYESATFAHLHVGGDNIKSLYEKYKAEM